MSNWALPPKPDFPIILLPIIAFVAIYIFTRLPFIVAYFWR